MVVGKGGGGGWKASGRRSRDGIKKGGGRNEEREEGGSEWGRVGVGWGGVGWGGREAFSSQVQQLFGEAGMSLSREARGRRERSGWLCWRGGWGVGREALGVG